MWSLLFSSVWFWIFVLFSLIGLVEIIVFVIRTINNAKYANEYIRHVDAIYEYALTKIKNDSCSYNVNELADIDTISNDIYEIEVIDLDKIKKYIDEEHYIEDPIYKLYYHLYYREFNKNEVYLLCHQIEIDYEKSAKRHEHEIIVAFIHFFVPLCKFYRGVCCILHLIKNALRKISINIDSSNVLEKVLGVLLEIANIIGVILEIISK